MTDLTTTSYAILGHLAMQDWTMYELAQQMRRNVHYFFPRAESQVYAEPKKLVALGLAEAREEAQGRRKRTVYAITPAGRAALAEWLASPVTKGPQLEFEALLRAILGPFGTEADLKATLGSVRVEISDMLRLADLISDEYLLGRAPFQRHILMRSMIHDFLFAFADLVDRWAERSLARADAWDRQTPEERLEAAYEIYRRGRRSPLPEALASARPRR